MRTYQALLQHCPAVVRHMDETSQRNTEEGCKCAGYLKALMTRKFIDGFSFLFDVLRILADVSLSFQKDELLVTDVVIKLHEATLKLGEW